MAYSCKNIFLEETHTPSILKQRSSLIYINPSRSWIHSKSQIHFKTTFGKHSQPKYWKWSNINLHSFDLIPENLLHETSPSSNDHHHASVVVVVVVVVDVWVKKWRSEECVCTKLTELLYVLIAVSWLWIFKLLKDEQTFSFSSLLAARCCNNNNNNR